MNDNIFNEKTRSYLLCAIQKMNILKNFNQEGNIKPTRMIHIEVIDKEGAWAYFDGVT